MTHAHEFYTRYADLYDWISTSAPLVDSLRQAIADSLDPSRGDVVVEMGCGTGGNVRAVRERVGREGTVVGIDFSAGVLERADERVRDRGWENVHLVRGDATRPPVAFADLPRETSPAGEVDCVLSTFVTGMVPDPAGVVDDWCRLVGPGGRICVVGFARSTDPIGRLFNPVLAGLVRLSTPPDRVRGTWSSPVELLDERALAAHSRVHDNCPDATTTRLLGGFVRITAGTVA